MKNKNMWRIAAATVCLQCVVSVGVETQGEPLEENSKMVPEAVISEALLEEREDEAVLEKEAYAEPADRDTSNDILEEEPGDQLEDWEKPEENKAIEEFWEESLCIEESAADFLDRTFEENSEVREEHEHEHEQDEEEAERDCWIEEISPETDLQNDVETEPTEKEVIREETVQTVQNEKIESETLVIRQDRKVLAVEGSDLNAEDCQVWVTDEKGSTIDFKPDFTEKEGQLECRLPDIREDGRYTLIFEQKGMENNQRQKKIFFTVNKKGSQFLHAESKEKQRLFSPSIRIKNYDDVRVVSCMVNGKEAAYIWDGQEIIVDQTELAVGKNVVTLVTKDGAGNLSSMQPWEIMIKG